MVHSIIVVFFFLRKLSMFVHQKHKKFRVDQVYKSPQWELHLARRRTIYANLKYNLAAGNH